MRKIVLLTLGLLYSILLYAQLPRWIISPVNDTVFIKVDDRLFQSESEELTSLWSMDGREMIFKTPHTILPFKEGVATIVKKGTDTLVGFVDIDGKFISLPESRVAYGNPYFEDGHLIVLSKNGYVFYNRDGARATFPESVRSYPFHEGYSTYLTFDQMDKKKDPHYAYYKANGSPMEYRMVTVGDIKAKEIDPKEIKFLSSIGTNGKGIAVIKNKLYWFIPEDEMFEPFLHGDGDSEKKKHLRLYNNYDRLFLNPPADSLVFWAQYENNKAAVLTFDKELRPVKFVFQDGGFVLKNEEAGQTEYISGLSESGSGPFGLCLNSQKILPEQFDEIGLKHGNMAIVKKNGKWGVMEIIPDARYSLKINKDEYVAFRHQKFDTQMRLDLPARISAKDARIDIPVESGCVIDKTSRETKDTESGNYVTYDCILNIPQNLPDTITTITYSPVKITYDGIALYEVPLNVKAWHLKYYNVDPIESETSIANGVAYFTININAQRNVGESDYPFDVRVEAESATVEYEKLSETRYKCSVSDLKEGINNINILVIEEGCPYSVFPFEVYYSKPAPRQKKKEHVVVRKKAPQISKPARIEL